MQLYQAPLEGISGYIYRQALHDIFGGVDKYYAPFISPYEKRIITEREINQLRPEHNQNMYLVPQILTMDASGFRELTNWLNANFGYDEFNLNFGCPSGTVVSKGRGAGSLSDLEKLKDFLDTATDNFPYKLSIKTRLGLHNTDEFHEILDLYNQYNLEELIIHPRIRDELYKGLPHMDIYLDTEPISRNPVVYNGNIYSKDDYDRALTNLGDNTQAIMIGRGMLANPAIFRELKGGASLCSSELGDFLGLILDGYSADFSGETPVLHKMKEIWSYMGDSLMVRYHVDASVIKKLKKSKTLREYKIYEKEVLRYLP